MRFDLTTITLFLNSVELRLIAGAVEPNVISPSAVSRRISDLEMRLGTTLIFHQTKGVTPTPAGDALARHACNLSHYCLAKRTLYVGVRKVAALTLAAHNMLTRLIDNPLQPMGRVK